MSDGQAKINGYRLEQAHLDWHSVRIQMAIGMSVIFFLCLVNFWPDMQLSVPKSGSLSVASGLLPTSLLIVLQLIAFILYFVSCLLTALITLEITGRFGNRLGASCALWAALLFCLFPWQIFFCMAGRLPVRIFSFVFLLAVFLCLRSAKNISWFIFFTGILLLAALGIYFHLSLYGNVDGSFLILRDSAIILSWTALSLGLSLICIPAMYIGRVKLSRVLGSLGLMSLIIFAFAFEELFTSITSNKKFENKYSMYSSLF